MDTTEIAKPKIEGESAREPKLPAKRRAVPRAQRLKYLRDWEESGLSAEAFASARPFKAQSLYRWRRQENSGDPAGAKSPSGGFAELKLAGLPSPASCRPEAILRSAELELSIVGCDVAALLPRLLRAFGKGADDV
jgi:hypothetical protein